MKKAFSEFRSLLRTVPPVLAAVMILSVVGMNLLANKSINTGLEWLALDCGIIFSWLTFLSMDVMTHCCGPRAASLMSVLALGLNLKECVGLSREEAGRGSHEDPRASVSRTLSIPEGGKPSRQRALNLLPFRPFYGLHLEEKNKGRTINRQV